MDQYKEQDILLLAGSAILFAAGLIPFAFADKPVEIQFEAQFHGEQLSCDASHNDNAEVGHFTPSAFRYVIHDINLINEQEELVPVSLDQDSDWQFDNNVVLSFASEMDLCLNNSKDINRVARGVVPAGKYNGLQFAIGNLGNLGNLGALGTLGNLDTLGASADNDAGNIDWSNIETRVVRFNDFSVDKNAVVTDIGQALAVSWEDHHFFTKR